MSISFNQIPIDIRVPGQYVEIDNSQAVRGLPGMPSRILVLGLMDANAEAPAGVPFDATSADLVATRCGRGSMVHRMVKVLRAANRTTRLTVIPLAEDPAAAAATGSLTFSGEATAAGTIALMVGGQRVRVGVTAGDTAGDIATAAAAALNAVAELPVSAAVNGTIASQVDLTARWKCEAGNSVDLRHSYYAGETLPTGVGLTITPMSGGTANPDLTAAIAAMGDTWFTDIAMPFTDTASLNALGAETLRRWGPTVMQDAMAYAFADGTHATLTTLGNSQNSQLLSIAGLKGCPAPAWEVAAVITGVAAYYLHIDPARPLQTLPLTGVLPPAEEARFTMEERNLLLHDGISTLTVDDGGAVLIERLITTYETNAYGIDDISYLDVNTLKTLAYLRYSVRARISMRFPRHKLASDGTGVGAGQAVVTPKVIRAELIALFRDWETAGLVENIDQFKEDLIVERDTNDPNRLNALIPPDLINQFRVFAGQVQFRL